MEKEYIIIGSDNFWYASCLKKSEVAGKIKHIRENVSEYCDPESGLNQEYVPETLYVYEAKEIKRYYQEEKDND